MTRPQDLLERVRAANPVPVSIEPDWDQIKEHVSRVSRAEADREQTASVGEHRRAALNRQLYRGTPARGGRRRLLYMLVAVAVAAGVAGVLVALAPWSGSSDFLARAAAALTPPPGTVLYERWEHIIAPEPGNPARKEAATLGPNQLWIEADSPHRYRTVLEPDGKASRDANLASTYGVLVGYVGTALNPRTGQNGVLSGLQRGIAGEPLELGGTTAERRPGEVPPTLTFLPPDELLSARLSVTLGATLPGPHDEAIENGTDPVSVLRAAIREGRAHVAGVARLAGRTVERIDLDLPQQLPADSPPLPANAPQATSTHAYAYVERTGFHPVEIVFAGDTYRFLAYEYLPPTLPNLALTSIRAQHPHAKILKPDTATE